MKHAIPEDWDGTFCRFSICWPDSVQWRSLLRGLVTEPARGFFWDEKTGSIRGVLSDFRQTVDQNIELECVIMSCSDATALIEALNTNFANLTEAIQALQLAVTVEPASPAITVEPASPAITIEPASPDINVNCSPDVNLTCGGGWSGSYPPPLPGYGPIGQGPIIQPPPNPGQQTPGGGPGGYEPPASWPGEPTEYDVYKCKASYFLVDGYINYVDAWARNWENISSYNTYASWMWGLFESSPWIALLAPEAAMVIAVYLATLEAGLELTEPFLDEYLDYLRGIRDDWACDFYNALSVDEARTVATNYVGGGGIVAWPTAIRDFHVDVMFKNYTLNILFEEYGPAAAYSELIDCSGCEVCQPELELVLGSGDVTPDGSSRTLSSAQSGDFHYIRIQNNSAPCCDYYLRFDSFTGSPTFELSVFNCAGQGRGNSGGGVPGPESPIVFSGAAQPYLGLFSCGQSSPFTLTVTIAPQDFEG